LATILNLKQSKILELIDKRNQLLKNYDIDGLACEKKFMNYLLDIDIIPEVPI
jgi:hypothetical protein